ncbi:MAG: glutathione-regulated potassium-efflux system protein KefC [Yokenella regensburgei]|jgi:glutathione-regulated potassium-efflux system ancillary protein KefC|uniref:Glutathione-regulated potassium-efflux system protein KefC n=1 Tax=Yokenella regensburgei TaxID=158877 RepID=A0AB38FWZ7_9ENTR|nr:glutathione-regulated potassium-efflux system protein KefC [Yokenella regensburgei]KAF1368184.1 glutathione-regulated potassium-efflux system ancillary protein KefC [Yokenella regensburgei]KFD25425.1 KefC family glutathione-regulated potassium-efflux system protein [Yokenella regensburgei ATCC 49455]MDQ4429329.1 glutathione-regulated potassium-efflux system protein KefC [Yokenella regensburgei]MDR3106394.1 glutathione-regulated potassium-efflux system protein KefC [Yokenella regensburgei]QI
MDSHTLIQALIYLGSAALIVPIAVRLGLGSVLGYLIAGCIIGPWGLRLVTDAESILHFAEIGVVLMLFVIGLELDPQRLWKLRASVFGGGALQMVACGVLIGGFCILLGLDWKVAELIGMTLALSSTAIAMQAMNERNLTLSTMGRSAFAVLLFQDIAAIPLVAMIPLLAASGASTTLGAFALSALKVAGALVLVVLLGRYVTRPVLRFVARSGLREVFSAVALFLVFGFGLLLEEVGLSMAMGAFLAGVLLASSEYRHALESDIEPFKGLLLGLFFIGVGMSVDFGTLMTHPLRILILLAGFLAIKLIMLWLVARPLGVPKAQRRWFAALLGQGSEFAFVVFGAAQMADVLDPEWAKALTLTVALSMAATPVLLVLLSRFEKTAGDEREADEIDEEQPRVIIAGFGRFGQIAGRLLLSSGVKMVILDHDPDHVETLRKFEMKVFYGDATRVDLLESAGAAKAEVIINAIDDPQASMQLTELVKEHFPSLRIISRARDVDHYIQLRQAGVEAPERETFEGALKTGRMVLEALGLGAYEARERADLFRRFNIQMVEEMVDMAEEDDASFAAVYKRTSTMLTGIINEDRNHLSLIQRHGWQGTEEGKHTGDVNDEPESKPTA